MAPQVKKLAQRWSGVRNVMYVGRALGFPIAMEGALKLKELSYVHAEGYAAGELKHGPIALLDRDTPLVAVATRGATYEKVVSNVAEVRAREAPVVAVATEGDEEIARYAADVLYVPEMLEELTPIIAILPLQLLAYEVAVARGHRCRPAAQPGQVGHGRVEQHRRMSRHEIGIDLVDIDRIISVLDRFPNRFRERVLTEAEARYCGSKVDRIAGRWAAKEAISKVLGLGRARRRLARDRDPAQLGRRAAGAAARPRRGARRGARPRGRHRLHLARAQDGHGRRDRPRPGNELDGGGHRADVSLGGGSPAASSSARAQGDVRPGAGGGRLHGVRRGGAARRAAAPRVPALAWSAWPRPNRSGARLLGAAPELTAMLLDEEAPGLIGPAGWRRVATEARSFDALVVGPGLGRHPATQRRVRGFLHELRHPVVIDADGLNALASEKSVVATAVGAGGADPAPR